MCDLFRNIFVQQRAQLAQIYPGMGRSIQLCTLLPGSSHRVSVFCYCTTLLECWLIETENESIFKKLSISWGDGELFHKSDPRRKHSAQGNPWYHLLQQPLSHRENFRFQGFYNRATSSQLFPSPVSHSFFMPQHYRKLYFYSALGYMRMLWPEVTCPGALTLPRTEELPVSGFLCHSMVVEKLCSR